VNEAGFLTSLRTSVANRCYWLKTNLPFARGIADLWLSGSRSDFWLEAKFAPKLSPATDLTDHRYWLTKPQQHWLLARHREGRQVGVLFASVAGPRTYHAILLPGDAWRDPIPREGFAEKAMPVKDLADYLVRVVGHSGELPLS
jgi:hypothetical protein